jgi:electron transfer flavoprotein alpha subunit
MGSICIIAEHYRGKLKKSTLNSISFGRKAVEIFGAELHLLVIGHGVADIADELKGYGAAKIHLVDDPSLKHYTAETWLVAVVKTAQYCDAKVIGMNAGTTGKDLMPRVAVKLNAGMASGVTGFDGACFTREMWAGSAVVTVDVKTDIKVVTIQQTAFDPAQPIGGDTPVETLSLSIPESKARFIEIQESSYDRPDLTEAEVVVSGGRGMKSRENFRLLEDFADLFGGAVGATRFAVDAGWVSNDLQVGQTGKIVAPKLYLAVGLSGSMQHTTGMKNSRVVVAINRDEEAPIFQIADFGLVGDLFKVMPELTEAVKKEKDI